VGTTRVAIDKSPLFIYLFSRKWILVALSQQIAHTQQETVNDAKAAPPTSQENTSAPSRFLEKGLRALEKDKYPLLYVI
jgi:hypothetical protein